MSDRFFVDVSHAYASPTFEIPQSRIRLDSCASLFDDRVIIPSSGDLIYVDGAMHTLRVGKSSKLLGKLAAHAGDVVDYEQLVQHIDGSTDALYRYRPERLDELNMSARILRRTLNRVVPAELAEHAGSELLKSVRRQGYMLNRV